MILIWLTASETNQKRKREIIRSYVTKYVLPRHEDMDEEDTVTLLTILVKSGLMDPTELKRKGYFTNNRRFKIRCKGAPREGTMTGRRRITTPHPVYQIIFLGTPFTRWISTTQAVC